MTLLREIRRFLRRCWNVAKHSTLAAIAPFAVAADLALDILVEWVGIDVDDALRVMRYVVVLVLCPAALGILWHVHAAVHDIAPRMLPSESRFVIELNYDWVGLLRALVSAMMCMVTVLGMCLHKLLSLWLAFVILWPWLTVTMFATWLFGLWLCRDL